MLWLNAPTLAQIGGVSWTMRWLCESSCQLMSVTMNRK